MSQTTKCIGCGIDNDDPKVVVHGNIIMNYNNTDYGMVGNNFPLPHKALIDTVALDKVGEVTKKTYFCPNCFVLLSQKCLQESNRMVELSKPKTTNGVEVVEVKGETI